MKTKKNLALEGLRGLAAMIVVFSHLALTFWPTLHTGDPATVRSRFDMFLFNSPLSFFYSGTFSVCVFFVMSGYVLSIKFVKTGDPGVIHALFIKRYFRLMPPVLVAALATYVLMRTHLMPAPPQELSEWIRSMFPFKPVFRDALSEGAWQGFLTGHSPYDPPAWTMQIEFLGSLLTFAACLFARSMKHPWMLFLLLSAALLKTQEIMGPYYASFIVGVWIAHLPARSMSNWAAAILLIVGAWTGGYHYQSYTHTPLYVLDLAWFGIHDNIYFVSNAISGILVFLVVLRNEAVGRFCARFVRLGSYSFSIYLIHFPILATVGVYVFVLFRRMGVIYNVAGALASMTVLGTTCLMAAVYYQFVDKPGIVFSEKMLQLLRRRPSEADRGGPAGPRGVVDDQPGGVRNPEMANISW